MSGGGGHSVPQLQDAVASTRYHNAVFFVANSGSGCRRCTTAGGAGVKMALGCRCGGTTLRGTTSTRGLHSGALTARWRGTARAVAGAAAPPASPRSASAGRAVHGGTTEDCAAGWLGGQRNNGENMPRGGGRGFESPTSPWY